MTRSTRELADRRMPQAILVAMEGQEWERLLDLDEDASVLMDLWDPAHLNRGHPADAARIRRLQAGVILIQKGFRLEDGRGSALSMLLDWYIPEPVSQELSAPEEKAWVQVFEALHRAGQSLQAPVVPDFEDWMMRDTWGWLASKAMFEPVAQALLEKGILRIYIPAQPSLKRWPRDPTCEVIEEGGFPNPSRYWVAAIGQGYPLSGTVGSRFIVRAVEWDMNGQAVRAALQTGQVDVHGRLGKNGSILGTILCSENSDFISPPALLALIEHDPSVLNALDSQGRSLHAVVLEYLSRISSDAPGAMGMSFNQGALGQIGRLVRAHRLSLRMETDLPAAEDEIRQAGFRSRDGRL